jgi:hypothetical protein
MKESIRKCLNCGAPLHGGRSTKKYCSDSCKQAAFYSRMAQPQAVHEPLDGNDDTVSDNGNEECEAPAGQPFNVKSNVTETMDKGAAHKPAAYRRVEPAPKPEVPDEIIEDDMPFTVRNNRKMVKPEPFNDRRQQQYTAKSIQPAKDMDEEPYVWTRSSLIDEIGDYVNDSYAVTEMFQYPRKYWYGSDLEKVKWVSVRLRSIVETILSFDKMDIERSEIISVHNALKAMTQASSFQFVPRNYPFKKEVTWLQRTIERIRNNAPKRIRIYFSKEKKIRLIGQRFLLADLIPFEPLDNLNFNR